jgi:hypothetical protein
MAADLLGKLQIKPGQALAMLDTPDGLMESLGPQLGSVTLTEGAPGATDAVLLFVTRRADVIPRAEAAIALLRPGGLLWVAYPKGGSSAPTDLNRDKLWEAMQPSGWRPVRQVAIDATWSGLRFRPADEVGR